MKLESISRYPENHALPIPLLFVHGAFMGAWVWEACFLPYMAQHGYAAHAVSLRGHGQSEGRERLPLFGLNDYVDDLEYTVREIGDSLVLIGHSMGGLVVQRFMQRHKSLGVVLMASVPPYGLLGSILDNAMRDPLIVAATGLLQSFLPRAMLAWPARRVFFSQDLPDGRLRKFLARMQPESPRAILEMSSLSPSHPRHRAKTPMLVIGGGRDALISTHIIQRTAHHYGTDAWICPNVAHGMMLEKHWHEVADHLIKWLNDCVTVPRRVHAEPAHRHVQ